MRVSTLVLLVLLVLWSVPGPVAAGPNAGGTLVIHDTGMAWTWDPMSMVTDPPVSCAAVDNELPVGRLPGTGGWIWKVYAVFPSDDSPRLKALAFGEDFTPNCLVESGGLPDPNLDFEIPQDGWPTAPGGASGISFGLVKTDLIDEVYWFAGYAYNAGETFSTVPHPVPGSRFFVDDGSPPNEDAIAGYSSIGFGIPGETICTEYVPGACCFADGSCEILLRSDCASAGGDFQGDLSCTPNPCPQLGACCYADESCVICLQVACPTGDWRVGESCDPNPCAAPPSGACCFPDGHCEYVLQSHCAHEWLGMGIICSPNPCPPPSGACCFPDGHCESVVQADCPTGDWRVAVPCEPSPCPSPPGYENEGGVLVVHDTGLTYTADVNQYPSSAPASCDLVDNMAPAGALIVWKVYAAFPEANFPRLKALMFGEDFNAGLVTIYGAGLPNSAEDFEVPGYGWPDTPGGGVGISFGHVHTDHIAEVYWFGGYGSQYGVWRTAPHPTGWTTFVDDSVPPVEAPIAGLGSIGFGIPGETPCGPPTSTGACCFPVGSCVMLEEATCLAYGGSYLGGECTPNPCVLGPAGACCFPDGHCESLPQVNCGHEWLGEGSVCTPNPCSQPAYGACCYNDGGCLYTYEANCPSGSWLSGVPCVPNPCMPAGIGACCLLDGSCLVVQQEDCPPTGTWFAGLPCDPSPCAGAPPGGACCIGETCQLMLLDPCLAAGGVYVGGACDPSPCVIPIQRTTWGRIKAKFH